MRGRLVLGLFSSATLACAWTMSVEFPCQRLPGYVWQRDLAQLKQLGVSHVTLTGCDSSALTEAIGLIRRLNIEADLDSSIPDALLPLTKSHGGPLTEPLAGAVRISASMPGAIDNERKLLGTDTPAVIWTDAWGASGELSGASTLRREAALTGGWGQSLAGMTEVSEARTAAPADGVTVRQYTGKTGSYVYISNSSGTPFKGDIRAFYPALQRAIGLPSVVVKPHDVAWLPVNISLTDSPLCSSCTGFGAGDHLAYATAELLGMEYENGILALEFAAGSAAEAVLQLSREPEGPLIAAGHPVIFDWDPKSLRARLPIPAANPNADRIRIAIAIDAPPATGYFDNTPVLLAGETTRVTALISPPGVAPRSRLIAPPSLTVVPEEIPSVEPSKDKPPVDTSAPVTLAWKISVPASATPGDSARIVLEADGVRISHVSPVILAPVEISLDDAKASSFPATIPVNRKSSREIGVTIRNNAPEIRTFEIAPTAPGLDFSPAKLNVSIGASVARTVRFRVFTTDADEGIHDGEIRVTGASTATEPVRFIVETTAH